MNQMLGNDSNLNDEESSGSSDDYSEDGETSDDEPDVKTTNSRRELEWDDSTMNF